MTGSERITEKILQEAAATAQGLLDAAKREADSIADEAAKRRDISGAESDRRTDMMIREVEQRSQAMLQLQLRKRDLTIRQQLVEEAFAKAATALSDLPEEAYRTLMTGMILSSEWEGDAQLVVSTRDRKRLGEDYPVSVATTRTMHGLSGSVRFADDSLPGMGGFVLRSGEMEINGTLDVVLSGLRPKLEADVVKALFEGIRE